MRHTPRLSSSPTFKRIHPLSPSSLLAPHSLFFLRSVERSRESKRGIPLCRNFAIFPLYCGARVLRVYERIEGKCRKKIFIFFFKGEGKILANNCFPCFFFFFNLFDWESFVKRWCVKISMKGRRFIKLWIIEVKTKRRQIIELILSLLNCSWINK